MFYMFDWTYLIVLLPAILLALYAQINVSSTFRRFSKIHSRSGVTAAQVARDMLDRSGLQNVPVERVGGNLTDHYDPKAKVLRLSESVYDSDSVASVGVAAHEVGHAIQDQKDYKPMRVRGALVPVTNLASTLSIPLILVGFLLSSLDLVYIGIIVFSATVLFQIVTLPVEFNASKRAIAFVGQGGYLQADEVNGAKKVLRAAALTYVASTLVALAQLLRFVLLANRRD